MQAPTRGSNFWSSLLCWPGLPVSSDSPFTRQVAVGHCHPLSLTSPSSGLDRPRLPSPHLTRLPGSAQPSSAQRGLHWCGLHQRGLPVVASPCFPPSLPSPSQSRRSHPRLSSGISHDGHTFKAHPGCVYTGHLGSVEGLTSTPAGASEPLGLGRVGCLGDTTPPAPVGPFPSFLLPTNRAELSTRRLQGVWARLCEVESVRVACGLGSHLRPAEVS